LKSAEGKEEMIDRPMVLQVSDSGGKTYATLLSGLDPP